MARRRAERIAVRGRGPRRRWPGAGGPLYQFFSMAVAGVCVAAALTMFFRVRNVAVEGLLRYTPEEIRAAAEVRDGDNLFLLNKYTMMDHIIRDLPYVEAIRIHRDLPDTLVIRVRECANPLSVAQDGSAWLISASGKIVDRVSEAEAAENGKITGCVLLAPEVGAKLVLEDVGRQQSLIDLLAALGDRDMMAQVGSIRMEDPGSIEMSYDGRFTVKLPYGADYQRKLEELAACLREDKIQENMSGTLDLTKDDMFYFAPTENAA